jgi:putative ABC transport system permease protein
MLRTCGMTGRQARNLILAETLMVALTACGISILFGITAAWMALDLSQQLFDTGTDIPPLIIPWLDLSIVCAVTITTALLAALLPAMRLGSQRPGTLLQQGRAAI